MRPLLAFAAVAEIATGVALVLVPALVGQWLFGVELLGVAMTVARVSGIALIGLGVGDLTAAPAGTTPTFLVPELRDPIGADGRCKVPVGSTVHLLRSRDRDSDAALDGLRREAVFRDMRVSTWSGL